MSTGGAAPRKLTPVALTGIVAVLAGAATVAVTALPFVRFAYRAPALHVALETANALIALLVAYLVLGRFRQNRRAQELLLVLALCSVAMANLALTAVPYAVTIGSDEEFSRWTGLAIRLLGTLLLVAAALTPPARRVERRRAGLAVLTLGAVFLAAGAVGVVFGDRLPPTVDPAVRLGDGAGPMLVAHPAVLGVQALGALLYAIAAITFTRQAGRTADELVRWVAAGCVLAATARIHYLLFPSLYSEYVYTGDLLRLGFYICLLIGAAREIRSFWELRTRTAVLVDRRRMARDLHDGVIQELAYIRAESHGIPGAGTSKERIIGACDRALDEARDAVQALGHPSDEPLGFMLHRAAEELAARFQVGLQVDLDDSVVAPPDQAHALVRITREAVSDAVRHGQATRVRVHLGSDDGDRCLAIQDDGTGFDVPAAVAQKSGYGLISMRERAEVLPGSFSIESSPGTGSEVRVTW